MLIGADFYWDVIEDHIIRGNGPTAVKSKIGYMLSGPIIEADTREHIDHIFNVITSHRAEESDLERFWSLESMGITTDPVDQKLTAYLEQYQQTSIEFTDGRYSAKLPWKEDHPPLPTNYEIARKRTENTIRRLSSQPHILKKYGDIITDQEQRGFIEKIDNSADTPSQVHYIPHHPVKKDSSTTPIRIVYDCSCRQSRNHLSLNDCLESTPPIMNELTSILVRFRMHKYAVCTDIEKAFLHVGLHPNDRDVTRFLWLNDPANPDSPLCTYRFKAVLFGATCSPFILNATLLKHLKLHESVKAAETMQRDLYVDNVLSSFQLQVELLTYFREARSLMSKAGMNLRSWTSNSAALRSQAAAEGVLDNDEVTKVLGMRWEPVADQMSFARREIPLLETVTKRTILRYSSRIYDPLGLLSPVTVRAKLLLQELWKLNYDWDIPLPSHIRQTWTVLANDLNTVTDVKFSRKLLIDPSDTEKGSTTECDTYLHIFVDASTKSYGATAYICNKSDSKLVMAKNRVAPLKSLTLPQLELMAALVGARLATHLHSCLNVSDVTFWSDSQIVLYWLNTNKPLKRFVQNRVIEIQSLTQQYEWNYCPTCDNPADLLTRGISTDQFISNNLWETGPTWILDGRLPPTNIANLQCTIQQGIHDVMDIERYSSYRKLLRVTAYVLRFISNCKKLLSDRQVSTLSVRELYDAEKKWLLSCQAVTYSTEISEIQSKMTCRSPIIRQLRLFLDDYWLIRCNGRIHNASLADVTKFPYLLPKKHPLTRLIVTDAHENQLHSGINSTVTQLRQKYWIPAIRQCAKSVLRKCVICRRVTGRPYTAPDTPPLPKIRVKESPPFSVTGLISQALFTSKTIPEVKSKSTYAFSHVL
ncbi:uncharacterized protein LOC128552995 [Mercenaria mercenaria]|uniref:uncharacterized protein LOC128552995 n=1 Tax=Mercenaria mercenaria TaxID=6596 RepID=UPI00234E3A78|nr:uncharacterized protein LOC128552995 [Mercenaria mercenaria]